MAKLFIFFVLLYPLLLIVDAEPTGFAVNLIHRDSPLSPFYNPNKTSSQRWFETIERSYARANHLRHQNRISANEYFTRLYLDGSMYLMEIEVGDPPVIMLVVLDTGSDIMWVQCEPCNEDNCTPLRYPRFDRTQSQTYRHIRCNDPNCHATHGSYCDDEQEWCYYSVTYDDGGFSDGELAYETLTLSSHDLQPFKFQDIIIGCSTLNMGDFTESEGGIFGLGMRAPSLITQLHGHINGFFSHCFMPHGRSHQGLLYLGRNGYLGEPSTTPYFTRPNQPYFYFLNLVAISVADKWYEFDFHDDQGDGNICIDSGTVAIMLPSDYYGKIVDAISQYMAAAGAERIYLPPYDNTNRNSLCYRNLQHYQIPSVTFHFQGADIFLWRYQLFSQINDDIDCLAILSGPEPMYGNTAQQYFWVEYNTVSRTVSFMPSDCNLS